jgi:hypothetical protein
MAHRSRCVNTASISSGAMPYTYRSSRNLQGQGRCWVLHQVHEWCASMVELLRRKGPSHTAHSEACRASRLQGPYSYESRALLEQALRGWSGINAEQSTLVEPWQGG